MTATDQAYLKQLEAYPCYGGLDLAAVSDLTCFSLLWPVSDKIYTHQWFFIPREGIAERCRHDNVPYDRWAETGHVELTQGEVTDWKHVTDRIKKLSLEFKIREIGYDPYGARDVVRELTDAGIQAIDTSQNILSLSSSVKRFEELTLSQKFVHNGHPVMRWNVDCSTVYIDPNGNLKVIKPQLNKSTKRVDGVIATIMALSRYQKAEPARKSVYATRGLLRL